MSSDRQQVLYILRTVRGAGSGTPSADMALRDLLRAAGWPGHVRAIRKAVERGWLLCGDGEPAALTLLGAQELAQVRASVPGGAATARRGRQRGSPSAGQPAS